MAIPVDILQLFPDLAAIGQTELQVYCNEWLKLPLPSRSGVVQVIVDSRLGMQVLLDNSLAIIDRGDVFIPIDELLDFIVDRHFADADQRRQLHSAIRDARRPHGELSQSVTARVGRTGTLYLVCKNPDCMAQMMSDKRSAEGQRVNCRVFIVECLKCGQIHNYEGSDFMLAFDK